MLARSQIIGTKLIMCIPTHKKKIIFSKFVDILLYLLYYCCSSDKQNRTEVLNFKFYVVLDMPVFTFVEIAAFI